MTEVQFYAISQEEEAQRLDNYLLRMLKGVPKSHIYRLIREGQVRINKKRADPKTRLQLADLVRIPPVRVSQPKQFLVHDNLKTCLLKSIIYEDKYLLVLNKPQGLAVHGGSGLSLGVIEAMRFLKPELPSLELVHRLDKETSGCLLLAKKRSTLKALQALFEARDIEKTYYCLSQNAWQGKKLQIVDVALKKNSLESGERIVRIQHDGKASRTAFKLVENFTHSCLIEAAPETGRTHQIRVHAAFLNHPIIGDKKYGAGEKTRLFLHAKSLAFSLADKKYYFEAEMDSCFTNYLEKLRNE